MRNQRPFQLLIKLFLLGRVLRPFNPNQHGLTFTVLLAEPVQDGLMHGLLLFVLSLLLVLFLVFIIVLGLDIVAVVFYVLILLRFLPFIIFVRGRICGHIIGIAQCQ